MSLPNTRRFFVAPEALRDEQVRLSDPDLARQIGRVLRLVPGDHVLLLDGLGMAAEVELTAVNRDGVTGVVVRREAAGGEPPVHLTLYLPLIRAERFEWAVQKGVELGARRLTPTHCARSLPADRSDARKLERWRRIAREAAEQSCRGILPEVSATLSFAAATEAAAGADLALLLWEGQAPHLRSVLRAHRGEWDGRAIHVLSGPEGGITPDELTCARERGIIPVSLGARVLRAETAPIAAIAMVLYEIE
ncbi:MAG: 16S rRNA (uracil(1498)-N(3))-methyltransferase [Oscillochloridaceae bacterium]|nr:16S rRNA (uracil(1498)-N(3))-methyltransferase [Chloroflexaceae bacterium]MDW8391207.1 16S rRNA (uracil(1498)-N(3))-methyltransferase [Oscillochloridaceae bacterium]